MNFHSARILMGRTLAAVSVLASMSMPTFTAWAAPEAGPKPSAPGASTARGVDAAPDPRQIPVPALATAFPKQPGPSDLAAQPDLPPVLRTSSGAPILEAAAWPARRAELRRVVEHYLTGHAPASPGNVRAEELEARELSQGKVHYRRVRLSFGPESKLGLDIGVFTPAGPGPFPALIDPAGTPPGASPLARLPQGPGQGQGVDALLAVGPVLQGTGAKPVPAPAPRALDAETIAREHPALARGYAYVVFDHNDCGEDTTLRDNDGSWSFRRTRFFPAYPGYDWGLLRAWAWGASRIVDYLVTARDIDAKKLMLTGFSRTGKAALIAGALDERIALTAPAATGGGGTGAFRRSGPGRGGKEGLDLMLKKYPNWFSPALHAFWGQTDRLPFDQHWLIAMIAPRAFIALEGDADPVSLASAVRGSFAGAAPVYALLGKSDALAVSYAPRAHAVTPRDYAALFDFADVTFGRTAPSSRRFDRFPPVAFRSDAEPAPARSPLWNGRDLKGWTFYANDPKVDAKAAVQIRGGVMRFDTPAWGYIKTERIYSDYHLHVEWRWPDGSVENANSGIMLHTHGPDTIWPLCFEAQLKTTNAGQVVGMGLDIPAAPLLNNRKRAPRFVPQSEVPVGGWNEYEIYSRGDRIEVYVNGALQNNVDQLPVRAGQIALQMEGFPIEFRNVWLEPLAPSSAAAAGSAAGSAPAPSPAANSR
jgi:hypothetical protein